VPIDVVLAQAQHAEYERCLASLGCEVHTLPAQPDLPDSVFVEDMAVVLDRLAIITRPGSESRWPEVPSIAEALRPLRKLSFIAAPATLDGGDVLVAGTNVFVGLSTRTNAEAVEQLRALLNPHGYTVEAVEVRGCLHLKSAATPVAHGTLVVNPAWIDQRAFAGFELIAVAPEEPLAGNTLLLGNTVICAAAFPKTRALLRERGISVVPVDVSELAKAEGGLTCCSLIFNP
jgi:dimethylargininase